MSRNFIKERVNKAAAMADVSIDLVDALPWPEMVRIARGLERINHPLAALRRAGLVAENKAVRLREEELKDSDGYRKASDAIRARIEAELSALLLHFPFVESPTTPTRKDALELFAAEVEPDCEECIPWTLSIARGACGRIGAAAVAVLPWRFVHSSEVAIVDYQKRAARYESALAELQDRLCSLRSGVRSCEQYVAPKVRELFDDALERQRKEFESRRAGSSAADTTT